MVTQRTPGASILRGAALGRMLKAMGERWVFPPKGQGCTGASRQMQVSFTVFLTFFLLLLLIIIITGIGKKIINWHITT